jgi:hypothetical protein
VPDRPGELLFSAGDGQLYRCFITSTDPGDADRDGGDARGTVATTPGRSEPILWQCDQPGAAAPFVTDPSWPTDRRLKRLVFVSLSPQRRLGNRMVFEPSKLWWLKMSEQGDAIVAAGRLTALDHASGPMDPTAERSPYIAVSATGQINVVYTARKAGARTWKLQTVPLELDGTTGEPHVAATGGPARPLAEELAVASLAGTADGHSIYVFTDNGEVRRFSIPFDFR